VIQSFGVVSFAVVAKYFVASGIFYVEGFFASWANLVAFAPLIMPERFWFH